MRDTRGRKKNTDYSYNEKLKYIIEQCTLREQIDLNDKELGNLLTEIKKFKPNYKSTIYAWRNNLNPMPANEYYKLLPFIFKWVENQIVNGYERLNKMIEFHKALASILHNELE